MKVQVLSLFFALLVCSSYAQEFCVGDTYTHLKSYSIAAPTLSKKPLTITANDGIVTNVKFVVIDESATSNVQVTVLGQGSSTSVASTVGHTLDSSNGLSITLKKVAPVDVSSASSLTFSRALLVLPTLLLMAFSSSAASRKQNSILLICGFLFALYYVDAADMCSGDTAGATIIITIPNGFAFSSSSYNLNNGALTCEADSGLFSPVCNSILINPIPTAAVPTLDTAGVGYVLKWLTAGIYFVSDGYGLYTTMFVVTDAGVIVIDAPPNLGAGYLAAIKSVTDQPVKYFVYSHLHTDHVGDANLFFNPDVTYIGHQLVYDAIALSNSPLGAGRILPNITFTTGYTLTLGNETLQLDFHGTMHSDGDTIIYSAAHKVVLFVDIVYGKWTAFRAFGETIFTQGYFKAHNLLLNNYDFDYYVSGHLGIMTNQDVQDSLTFVEAVRTATISALTTQMPPDIGTDKNGNTNYWLQFNVYLDRVAEVCCENIRTDHPDYFVKYAGLDVFLFSHCDSMVRSMRLE